MCSGEWQPYPRDWINVDSRTDEEPYFTVMTYNILAGNAESNSGYKYVKEGYLKMEDRHPRIMKEIDLRSPDILCLQEVETGNLNDRLIPDLKKHGYSCASNESSIRDGPATFFRQDKFVLECCERVVANDAFMDLLKQNNSQLSSHALEVIKKYLNNPREFVVAKFKCKTTGKFVTVANIHVLWGDLEWPTIQTSQVSTGLERLLQMSGGDDSPYIFTGDFNSLPTGMPYRYLQDGRLLPEVLQENKDAKLVELANGETFRLYEVAPLLFLHDEPIKNAYLEVKGQNPDATNCDPLAISKDEVTFLGCLDYLWYNRETLGCSGVVDTPPGDLLREEVGLPNTKFPSDHIYLMARFSFL